MSECPELYVINVGKNSIKRYFCFQSYFLFTMSLVEMYLSRLTSCYTTLQDVVHELNNRFENDFINNLKI